MQPVVRKLLAVAGCTALVGGYLLVRERDSTSAQTAKSVPPAAAKQSPFVVGPYLQYPTRDSITIMWETPTPATAIVDYGETALLAEQAAGANQQPDTMHEVLLKGLKPNTRYLYRVTSVDADGKKTVGDGLQFMTAVDEDSAFSFGIIGDTQKNPQITGQIAKLIWDRRPHFVIHVGDVVDNGADKKEWVNELFGPCRDLFSRVPVYPCIGNHEKNHPHYYKYFSLPQPEYYYRYRYGNADFFVLDTNKPVKPDSEQYKWLDAELGKSTAKWKICYHHHPAWSSDDNDYGDTTKNAGRMGDLNVRNLVALYEKHNVDLVFNGHIHLYERTWPLRNGKVSPKDGVTYITSGGGGGRLENFGPLPTWFKAQLRVDFHFCYVNVHGGHIEFKVFDQKGNLFDTFDLRK